MKDYKAMFTGVQVIACEWMTTGVRPKRRHKRKRIQKKWIKRYGYEPIPNKQVYLIDGKLCGHPKTINKILQKIGKE